MPKETKTKIRQILPPDFDTPKANAPRIEFYFMSTAEALSIMQASGMVAMHVLTSKNSVVIYPAPAKEQIPF